MKIELKQTFFPLIVLVLVLCSQCSSKEEEKSTTLFNLIDGNKTNIHFKNTVKENLYFNFLN